MCVGGGGGARLKGGKGEGDNGEKVLLLPRGLKGEKRRTLLTALLNLLLFSPILAKDVKVRVK